jgi:hypothetical protein
MIVHARTPEQEAQLATYIAKAVGITAKDLIGDTPYHALASVRDDRLMGAVMFINYRGNSVEVNLCGSPGWVTRSEIRELFEYAFRFLGCLRLNCTIRRNNKPARRGAERLGFSVRCVLRDEYGRGKDAILYDLHRDDCKWLSKDAKL